MIFCHIFDDYVLQGCLANLKQKSWWEKNAPDKLYAKDYIMALFMHSYSWSFPINIVIHMIADDLKANKHKINLIQDQLSHICQICCTLVLFILIYEV